MSYQVELNIEGVQPYINPGCQNIAEDTEHEKRDIISLICKMSVSGKVIQQQFADKVIKNK